MKELNTFREFLNENEVLDRYDKASKKLFDMTWDEVQRENDPRMKQDVHDEVQKDDDLDYIDDVQESQSISQGFYEVDFIEMDGNEVTRDFRHFTDENEAKQMFNDLKTNPEIVKVTRSELFKGDGKNYLGGSEEREYSVNKETDLHRIFLNSRLGDKRFEEPEPIMQFFGRKNQAREEFMSSPELNEKKMDSPEDRAQKRFDRLSKDDQTKLMKLKAMMDRERDMEESNLKGIREEDKPKGIREEDDEKGIREETSIEENMPKAIIMRQIRDAEEILDSGEADGMPLDNETEMLVRQELKRLKQMAGGDKKEKTMKFLKSKKSYRENLNLEEIYKDIMEVDKEEEKIRKEYDSMKRPSQDEVNDAFEKFNREAHYLNNKPVSKWDAADMSNWKSILSKGGKIK
ncbi:hypothetical protein N9F67_00600 [bacterium]|nr:hypothetical protein [bacterium]